MTAHLLPLLAYIVLLLGLSRIGVRLMGWLERRATRRLLQDVTTKETLMTDRELTRESLARLRAKNDQVTAAVRLKLGKLAGEPDADIQVLGNLIMSNAYGNPLAVADIAALTTLDLALAQAEIIRLQAELDGEKAAHKACHDGVRRATRGGS